MKFKGMVSKEGSFWLAEVAALDVMSQGKTRKQAIAMVFDAICLLIDDSNVDLEVDFLRGESFSLQTTTPKLLIPLFLKRQRSKNEKTLKEMASALGARSINSYAQYEQGKSEPSLSQLQKILAAMGSKQDVAFE